LSSSECDSKPEEAEPGDGFGWVDMPQNDIMGVECQKFIADELNIEPSSPFLLNILSDQPQPMPPCKNLDMKSSLSHT
jgi:hypothetical protein